MGLFDLFDSKEKKRRLSYVLSLLSIAAADGNVDDDEIQCILKIAIQKGVSVDEFKRVVQRPESVKFTPPESIQDRIELIYHLVIVMMVNGEIDDTEFFRCKQFAETLGFNHSIIDNMVKTIIEKAKAGADSEKTAEEISHTIS